MQPPGGALPAAGHPHEPACRAASEQVTSRAVVGSCVAVFGVSVGDDDGSGLGASGDDDMTHATEP